MSDRDQLDEISKMPSVVKYAGLGGGSVVDAVATLVSRAVCAEKEREEARAERDREKQKTYNVLTKLREVENEIDSLTRAHEAGKNALEGELTDTGALVDGARLERDEALADVARLHTAFRHTHVGPDERCTTCGLDLRDEIHAQDPGKGD